MKFIRFLNKNKILFGILNNNVVTEINRNFLFQNYKKTKKKYYNKIKLLSQFSSKIIFVYNYKIWLNRKI